MSGHNEAVYLKIVLDKFSLSWYDNSRSRDVTIVVHFPGG